MLLRFNAQPSVAARAVVALFAFASCALASPPPPGPSGPSSPPNNGPGAGKVVDLKPLVPSLSPETHIFLPDSDEFSNHTIRWSNLAPPTPNVVILPATEKDVVKIVSLVDVYTQVEDEANVARPKVKFASEKNIPILGYNGHHGTITTLGRMKYGIQISLKQLNSITIAKSNTTVTIGGGTNSKLVTDTLWAAGKQTGKFILTELRLSHH